MRDYIYVGSILSLVPVILYRPWIGILAWTVLGLINPQQMTWAFTDFPFAQIIGGATLVGLLFTKERRPVPLQTQTVLLAVLALWATLTTFSGWAGELAWEQWDKVMKIFLMIFVTIVLIYGRKRILAFLLTIVLSIAAFGVKGAVFTVLTGGVYRVEGPGGYIGGNTGFGCALVMILPLIAAAARTPNKPWMRLAMWVVFWLVAIAVVFTYSRGALLGLVVVMLMMFFGMKRKLLGVVLLVPALVVGIALMPDQLVSRAETIQTFDADSSAMGRVQAWGVALNVAARHPLGAGFELDKADNDLWLSYAFFSDPMVFNHTLAAHSIYFQVLGEHGFVGLAIYLGLLASTFLSLGRIRSTALLSDETRWMSNYASALRISVIGYFVAGAFLSLAYFDLFYAFFALSIIMQRECNEISARKSTAPVPSSPGGAPPSGNRVRTAN